MEFTEVFGRPGLIWLIEISLDCLGLDLDRSGFFEDAKVYAESAGASV